VSRKTSSESAEGKRADAGDRDLNGVIGAAAGEPVEPDPRPDLEGPKIQPAGSFPSIEDAFADMSQPPPAPPVQHLLLEHSSTPPRAAFRTQPRVRAGIHLWMFALPYGTAMQGEAFVHPIVVALREPLIRACPALTPRRFEIRLILEASGKYSLLEVPADPALTTRGEETRQSLLRLIEHTEVEWTVPEKLAGGKWGATTAAYFAPTPWPAQSLHELSTLTYRDALIASMDHPILQRYRKKIG
jgi:hypothetical protein